MTYCLLSAQYITKPTIKFSHYLERQVLLGSQGGWGHICVLGGWADSEALCSRCLIFEHSMVATLASRPISQEEVNKRRPGRSHRHPAKSTTPALALPAYLPPTHIWPLSSVCLNSTASWGENQVLGCDIGLFSLLFKKKWWEIFPSCIPAPSPLSRPQLLRNEITQDINKML